MSTVMFNPLTIQLVDRKCSSVRKLWDRCFSIKQQMTSLCQAHRPLIIPRSSTNVVPHAVEYTYTGGPDSEVCRFRSLRSRSFPIPKFTVSKFFCGNFGTVKTSKPSNENFENGLATYWHGKWEFIWLCHFVSKHMRRKFSLLFLKKLNNTFSF